MIRTLLASLTLVLASTFAHAQTGPSSGGTGVINQAGASVGMKSEGLQAYLKKQGIQYQVQKLKDGSPLITSTIVKDGWNFVVEFEYNKAETCVTLVCPLGLSANLNSQQMQKLLKHNYTFSPAHFAFREHDGKLVFEDMYLSPQTMNEQFIQQTIDRFLKTIRDTHTSWGSN